MTTTLDVFISSKMLELKPERDALYKLFPTLNYGDIKLHAWVFEEDAPASEQSIRDIYLKALQNSALYLGLFWNQYGDYTIDEFERATEWGMERHIYVKDVDAKERDERLADFLNKHGSVTSGITAKWFKTTDELCEVIKKTLDKWVADYRSGPLGEPNAWLYISPAEIVERAEKLIGREDLLGQVNSLLDQNAPVLLHGFSGSGKTALAAELASTRMPALWLRVGRNNADALFEALAREFDAHQEIAKQTGEGKIRLMRSILAQSDLKLLVLDDAWNGQALQAVIRAVPPTLPLLVTSRRIYSLRQLIKVTDLSPDKAVELLSYHSQENYTTKPGAHELCSKLGYLAFAIRIAGVNLWNRKITPEKLIFEIENIPHELEPPPDLKERGRENVAKLIQVSLDALDAETRAVFFACGAFFATTITPEMMMRFFVGKPEISDEQLANIRANVPDTADLPDDQLRELLQIALASSPLQVGEGQGVRSDSHLTTLAHHGLIEHIPSTEKAFTYYRLHDLAYSYARAANDDAAHHRALDACLAYLQGYNQPSLANFAALRPELPNLLAAADWAFAAARYADAERFAADLYPQGSKILDYDGLYTQAIRLCLQAAEAARRQNKPRNQGAHFGNLGSAYHNLGQYERAIQYHEQALTIRREIGDRRGEGNDLGSLGNAYRNMGQYTRAIENYEQALTISREIGDRRGEGNRLGNLGNAYLSLGQYARAIEYHEQALSISREIGDRKNEGIWLGNLGIAYDDLGQYDRAIENYEQALSIRREIGDRLGEANDLNNIGALYESQGDYPQALNFYQQARDIRAELGIWHMVEKSDQRIANTRAKMAGTSGDPEP